MAGAPRLPTGAASELAFLRRRAAVDGVEPDRNLEQGYLRALGRRRSRAVPGARV